MAFENGSTTRKGALEALAGDATPDSSAVVGEPRRMVEIETVRKGEAVLETETVPRRWYEQVTKADRLTQAVKDVYLGDPGVLSIGTARWDRTFGGKAGHLIGADVDPDTYEGTLPEELEGIPVRTRETGGGEPTCVNADAGTFTTAPDGVGFDDGSAGTCFLEVLDDDDPDEPRLLSANHVWERRDAGGAGRADERCGSVARNSQAVDYALVEKEAAGSDEEGPFPRPVVGYRTKDGVRDLVSADETVRALGITTGVTEGPVTRMNEGSSEWFTCDGEGVQTAATTAEGDSGGPVYALETVDGERGAVVVHMNSAGAVHAGTRPTRVSEDTRFYENTRGAAFYHLRNEHDIYLA